MLRINELQVFAGWFCAALVRAHSYRSSKLVRFLATTRRSSAGRYSWPRPRRGVPEGLSSGLITTLAGARSEIHDDDSQQPTIE